MKTFCLDLSRGCPKGFEALQALQENTAITVGNFDGVHLGHVQLIRRLVEEASKRKLKSLVLSFHPHPLHVLSPAQAPCELSNPSEKAKLMETLGVDYLVFIKFDREFSKIRAVEFLEEILFKKLGMRFLFVGYDWRFGYRREGEIELAKEVGEKLGFEVKSFEPYRIDGHIVSSTLVRRLLREGRLEEAKRFLGRDYWIERKVVKGDGRGSKLGFPTANLSDTHNLCLKEGVYKVRINGELLGVANYGLRPTFGGKRKVLEVHILNFSGNLVGKTLRVEFLSFIREERKFSSVDELKRQIEEDIRMATHEGSG
ncbi:bifunctional riboflavin kinase/FAD synthetase [Thermocrinis minervae]|uniref:Riboflavin biosynthesis protein n=1 Tax=Thermocrinis minervae TaxID=381751 RepID=A0A1M6SIC9_9AQUI|nr:bifunctional riboflavin kinase/FAD synthetase [Thermocrinis minervae]SHK44473.1 FMN adenylyltransferase /riboflavin kinase [Thermocrinis minervae]